MDNNSVYLVKRLAGCLKGRQIKEYRKEEILPKISDLIVRVYTMYGYQQYNEKDISTLAMLLLRELRESYFFLTFEEVAFCLEQGAKGEWDTNTGVNFRTFVTWLKAYRKSRLRNEAKLKREQQAENPVTEEEKRSWIVRHVRYIYIRYKAGIEIHDAFLIRGYQNMQELGWINDCPEIKRQAMQEAEEYLHERSDFQALSPENQRVATKERAMIQLLLKHLQEWKQREENGQDILGHMK